uniref:Uncharacterized protein n=1 Tax=Arundo donax TaxID=35708 RepID=A0A0A9FBF2_ARUDO
MGSSEQARRRWGKNRGDGRSSPESMPAASFGHHARREAALQALLDEVKLEEGFLSRISWRRGPPALARVGRRQRFAATAQLNAYSSSASGKTSTRLGETDERQLAA